VFGGAAQGHVHGHGIHEGFPGHDLTCRDAPLEHVHDGHARVLRKLETTGVHGGDGTVAAQAHADGLGEAVHGVGGVHARAGTAGGTGLALPLVKTLLVDLAGGVGTHGLEHAGEARLVAIDVTGKHGTTRDEGGGRSDGQRP